jgi:hypothetical protein
MADIPGSANMISVHARVSIAFEHFALSAYNCGSEWTDDVWLEYGRGPKRQPTTWCCGDMIPRDRLVLTQNSDFRNFHRLLTAERRAKGCYAGQCYVYDVTATIIGRFDAVKAETERNGTRLCNGFGQFGVYCTRLVIQKVSNVVAEKATELKRMN